MESEIIVQHMKAPNASVYGNISKRNGWRIACMYYPIVGLKGTKKETSGYESKEAAEAELEVYRYAVEIDGAKSWQSPNIRRSIGISAMHQQYVDRYTVLQDGINSEEINVLSGKKHGRDELVLDCCQSKCLSKIKRNQRRNDDKALTRRDFSSNCNFTTCSEVEINPFLRSLSRVRVLPSSKDDQTRFHNVSKRKNLLKERLDEKNEVLSFLIEHVTELKCDKLLIRLNEEAPRKDNVSGDFSNVQLARVAIQARTVAQIFVQLRNRDSEELKLLHTQSLNTVNLMPWHIQDGLTSSSSSIHKGRMGREGVYMCASIFSKRKISS